MRFKWGLISTFTFKYHSMKWKKDSKYEWNSMKYQEKYKDINIELDFEESNKQTERKL